MKKGMLIVISGPAGCGKDTIIESLLEKGGRLSYSVSATTRGIRMGEEEGKHYFFKTRDEFERLIKQGEFLEYTEYCGNYYGTLRETVAQALDEGKNIILKIEVEGAANIRKVFSETKMQAGLLAIFIMPPSLDELRRRLKSRSTEDDATIELRIKKAGDEIAFSENYDYKVVNDDLQTAIDETAEIINQSLCS
ncbi:MAG: guanylate kinase [Oscillospiraceae bacterium]|nr:guanylate kinase [Oscillospiraceae bacterium]